MHNKLATKIRRQIKLIRTASHQEKMEWAGWVVVVLYLILDYLKGGR